MKFVKTSIGIVGVVLLVAGCNKAQTSNTTTENTVVTENTSSVQSAPAENVAAENAATANDEAETPAHVGNGVKDDTGPRH